MHKLCARQSLRADKIAERRQLVPTLFTRIGMHGLGKITNLHGYGRETVGTAGQKITHWQASMHRHLSEIRN